MSKKHNKTDSAPEIQSQLNVEVEKFVEDFIQAFEASRDKT